MHFETDGNDFIEVKVRNKIQSRGEEHGIDTEMAMDIPFSAKLHASYILPRLAIQERDISPELLFHGVDGHVRRFGMKSIAVDREYNDYRMTISFSALDTENMAEAYACEKIHVTKLIPEEGHLFTVEFTVQLKPHRIEDIGNLCQKGIQIGIKQCFLQFEEIQKDLASAA